MKVVIIGNGIGGFSVASNLRRMNNQANITMISNETTPLYSACVLPDYLSGKISREKTFVKTQKDYKKLGIHTLPVKYSNLIEEAMPGYREDKLPLVGVVV